MTRKAPAVLRPKSVLETVQYGPAEANAMYLLSRGEADSEQQLTAYQWIIDMICRTDDLGYEPGESGRRDTDFLQGMRHVGLEIRKMSRVNPAILEKDDG